MTAEGLPTRESSGNRAPVGVGPDVQQKPTIKQAAGRALFACLLALGGLITIAWAITLLGAPYLSSHGLLTRRVGNSLPHKRSCPTGRGRFQVRSAFGEAPLKTLFADF
jgi:hypothetical protein